MRLIDADEIRIKPDFILYGVCGTPVIRCEDLARIINDMPTIEPQKWISVKEMLPERCNYYIVTDFGSVEEAYYNSDGRWFSKDGNKLKDVTAWMPLPEPYGGE